MSTLVFLEHHEGELQKDSLGVLGKAAQLGGDVSALIAGSGVEGLAPQAGKYGATKVYVADDPALEAPLPQPRVDVAADLVRDRDTVQMGVGTVSAALGLYLGDKHDIGVQMELITGGIAQLVRDGLPLGLELAHGVDVHDVPATGGGSVGSVVLLPTLHVGLHATSVHPLVVLLVLRLPPGLLFWRQIAGPARDGRSLRRPRWLRHASRDR